MACAVLLLAGGASSRWGKPKALLPWGDDCLVNHLANVALASGANPVVRVLGAHAEAITVHSASTGVSDVFNPAWATGMGSSIACGMRHALKLNPALHGVIVLPCDLPLVTADLLNECVWHVVKSPAAIVHCDYRNGAFGPPAAFGSDHFPALLALNGDEGGRRIIQAHSAERIMLPFADGRWDLDSPADLARFNDYLAAFVIG